MGANVPYSFGAAFAWGETQTKDYYDWGNYQHCNGSENALTKYCNNPDYGYNGYTDDLTVLEPIDDAATANWGEEWCMPTMEQWVELSSYTTYTPTTQNGVVGGLFTAPNGNSIFIPLLEYWASSLCINNPVFAFIGILTQDDFDPNDIIFRSFGRPVRPVRSNAGPIGEVPEGAINGLFSVGEETGTNGYSIRKVYFSQGNLQYQASTNTWRFAENQWDCVGEGNNNISPSYDGWIDLFGWGTSGYDHGAVCYQPWSTSENASDYWAYGQENCNLYDQSGRADWGYNAIYNGGNTENIWRTLTYSEWNYVLNTRNTASGIRFVRACVNNVDGALLLPDDWDASFFTLNNPNDGGSDFSDNMISASQWNSMEERGVVFMPAAGLRTGNNFNYANSYGGYWSSQSEWIDYAWDWYFSSFIWLGTDVDYKDWGLSVRLVHDAPNGDDSGSGGGTRK